MIDEIDPIEPISKKRKTQAIPDLAAWVQRAPVYTGSFLPHHFEQLILKGNYDVVQTSSDNNYRNRLEMREWRIEDEARDVWRRLDRARNYNSFLNRKVVLIPKSLQKLAIKNSPIFQYEAAFDRQIARNFSLPKTNF